MAWRAGIDICRRDMDILNIKWGMHTECSHYSNPICSRNSLAEFLWGNTVLGTETPRRAHSGSHPSSGFHSSKRSGGDRQPLRATFIRHPRARRVDPAHMVVSLCSVATMWQAQGSDDVAFAASARQSARHDFRFDMGIQTKRLLPFSDIK